MKTNGLRNKKPAMASSGYRNWCRDYTRRCYENDWDFGRWTDGRASEALFRWHRAAKGRK